MEFSKLKRGEPMEKLQETKAGSAKQETLISWLSSLTKAGVKSLPSVAKTMVIQIAIVILIQVVFWWDAVARYIPGFIKMPVIFLTATYNNIIPKTLYWVILFTFGKKLLMRVKNTGFRKAMRPILWLGPELKKAYQALGQKALALMLLGGGFGLAVANNFASYSRFSGARNKLDKYFVALVISFTISYLLGEGRKHWLFQFARLSASDATRLLKAKNDYTDNHTYVLLSGFVGGLLLDAPLILLHLSYGGYILGGVGFLAGIAVLIISARSRASNDYTE